MSEKDWKRKGMYEKEKKRIGIIQHIVEKMYLISQLKV